MKNNMKIMGQLSVVLLICVLLGQGMWLYHVREIKLGEFRESANYVLLNTTYRYLYDEDGRKFAEAVKNRDAKMVEFINEELALVGGEKAVIGGAYFDRNKVPAKYRFTEEEVKQLRAQREERIQEQKEEIDKMIDNNPAKGNLCEERTTRMGKKSIRELDDELTDLQDKERQARELCEQYEKQLPNKNDQEL